MTPNHFRQRIALDFSMPAIIFGLRTALVIFMLAPLGSNPALAGRNQRGAIMLHTNESLTYTNDYTGYPGQSGIETHEGSDCAAAGADYFDAKDRVDCSYTSPGAGTFIVYALAAFPEEACPAVAGVTFGVNYSPWLTVVDFGTQADFVIGHPNRDGDPWPAPGSAVALAFDTPRYARFKELCWFAVEDPGESAVMSLVPHPVQGGYFADNTVPAVLDLIEHYNSFGAYTEGDPCGTSPTTTHSWGQIKHIFGR